jgi:nucleobase:cation symporter-1, NCS1 family
MNLLSFVCLYGTVLAPIGAIIIVDFYFAERCGVPTDPAERAGAGFNVAVLLAWLLPVGVALYLYRCHGVFASFLPLPCAIACAVLYVIFSWFLGPTSATTRTPLR